MYVANQLQTWMAYKWATSLQTGWPACKAVGIWVALFNPIGVVQIMDVLGLKAAAYKSEAYWMDYNAEWSHKLKAMWSPTVIKLDLLKTHIRLFGQRIL